MTDKFFPTYQLEVQTADGSIVIPGDEGGLFNLTANITYTYSESPNTCSITVYNLKKETRDAIFHDAWNYFEFRKMTFKAGYGGNLMTLFDGNIKEAYSDRSGVDVTTKIDGWDCFWYNNNFCTDTVPQGATRNQSIDQTLQSIRINDGVMRTGEGKAAVVRSDFSDMPNNLRSETLYGRPQDIIKERIGQQATLFYDSGKLYVLKDNDVVGDENDIPVINSATGLLGVPTKRNRVVEFKMLFEPSLRIGRAFKLESNFSSMLNGTYKIMGVTHNLSLGENIGGENITSVKAWNTNQGFNFLGMM